MTKHGGYTGHPCRSTRVFSYQRYWHQNQNNNHPHFSSWSCRSFSGVCPLFPWKKILRSHLLPLLILMLISITVQKTANLLRAQFFLRLLVSNYVRPLKQVHKFTLFQALVSEIKLAFSHPINRVHNPISVEQKNSCCNVSSLAKRRKHSFWKYLKYIMSVLCNPQSEKEKDS